MPLLMRYAVLLSVCPAPRPVPEEGAGLPCRHSLTAGEGGDVAHGVLVEWYCCCAVVPGGSKDQHWAADMFGPSSIPHALRYMLVDPAQSAHRVVLR